MFKTWFYLRQEGKNKGDITFAWRLTEEGIESAISVCSVKDNFNKSIGRELATKRLLDGDAKLIDNETIYNEYIPQMVFGFVSKKCSKRIIEGLLINDLSLNTIKHIILNEVSF
jgi:hypothetical protein